MLPESWSTISCIPLKPQDRITKEKTRESQEEPDKYKHVFFWKKMKGRKEGRKGRKKRHSKGRIHFLEYRTQRSRGQRPELLLQIFHSFSVQACSGEGKDLRSVGFAFSFLILSQPLHSKDHWKLLLNRMDTKQIDLMHKHNLGFCKQAEKYKVSVCYQKPDFTLELHWGSWEIRMKRKSQH